MKYIVYKITNDINDKVYIGQTTETLEKRWKRHCGYQLNDGTYLHKAMKKYGIDKFHIEEIAEADNQEELDKLEYQYIIKYKDNSYNTKYDMGKSGGDTLTNNENLDKIKIKISNSKLGGKNPNSTKVKMIDKLNNTEEIFNSYMECQIKYDIPRHDIIGRRCSGKISKLYRGRYMFEYVD